MDAEVGVVLRRVVEAGLVGLQGGDEPVAVGITHAVEPVVVPPDLGQHLVQEGAAALAAGSGQHRLRQHRGLDAVAEVRRAIGDRIRLQHLLEGLALPEGDVGHEAVGLLVLQQRPHLAARALGIDVGQGHGVEAGVPEPLERIGAHRRADEVVVVAAPGGVPALAVAVVERAHGRAHALVPLARYSSHSPSSTRRSRISTRRMISARSPRAVVATPSTTQDAAQQAKTAASEGLPVSW